MTLNFEKSRNLLLRQFENPEWITDSGIAVEEIEKQILLFEQEPASKMMIKAKSLDFISRNARIAVDKADLFQDKLDAYGLIKKQRLRWEQQVMNRHLSKENEDITFAWQMAGAYRGNGDYSHTSPNSRLLMQVGLPGLIRLIDEKSGREGLTDAQNEYYSACRLSVEAIITVAHRLADAIEPCNPENSRALRNLTQSAPGNIYEAMQLLVLYFFFHDFVGGTRVRTLGRLDVLLTPFYFRDLEKGTFTKQEIRKLFKFFLYKFWSAKVPFDLPFCLGGLDVDGHEATNELSALIVEVYNELNIYSPKIHIRVSEKTPPEFVKMVLNCIRNGNSSFVFVNDTVAMKSLAAVGIEDCDLRDYVPIGCYEPAIWGIEMGCTGNGWVNLPKALEFVITRGHDHATGKRLGLDTGAIASYDEFLTALKKQIAYMTEKALNHVIAIEKHYGDINPDPLLSCQYVHSLDKGVDVYEGGAKYNNSSMYFYSIASFVDAVCAVKELVFDQNMVSFREFCDILKADWDGYESLRQNSLRLTQKYGNNCVEADDLAAYISEYCASLVNNIPNGRGGVFKAALFTIDNCYKTGKKTMATPDGRHAGQPLSKNLCAVTGMDRKGITSLIHSVCRIDHALFPNGSVLDVVLHPTAVAGEEGLHGFYSILLTYFRKGGLAMHGNVFSSKELKQAQVEPEKYRNLQVRVCGWNAYFVNLSREEQNAFIRQSELNEM